MPAVGLEEGEIMLRKAITSVRKGPFFNKGKKAMKMNADIVMGIESTISRKDTAIIQQTVKNNRIYCFKKNERIVKKKNFFSPTPLSLPITRKIQNTKINFEKIDKLQKKIYNNNHVL